MVLPIVTVNGVADGQISPLDRGFSYGDGLFETCRCAHGHIPLWPFHHDRLAQSARQLHIPLDQELLQTYVNQALVHAKDLPSAVVRIQVTRGVSGRGYRMPKHSVPTYVIALFPGEHLESVAFNEGVKVRLCDTRLGMNTALAGLKHLNRLEQIVARAEWEDEFSEGIMLDTLGNVIEGTFSNLFLVKNNRLITPELSSAGVSGVMRRATIERFAPSIQLVTDVAVVNLNDLKTADEVFLTNSVFGIWPVREIAGVAKYNMGSITRMLQTELIEAYKTDRAEPERCMP